MRHAISLLLLLLSVVILVQPIADGQVTSHYGAKVGDSGANLVGFDLTVYSPNNQTVYSRTMPLNFKIHWLVGVSPFMWTLCGLYTYRIDNQPVVDIFPDNPTSNFSYNPSFSHLLDVSGLSDGKHSIVISAGFYYKSQSGELVWKFLNETSSPLYFEVQNSNPTSTASPIVQEIPTAIVITFLIVITLAIVMIRKTNSNLVKKL